MANITIAGEKLTPYNYTPGNISRIKYIVIHYVGALGGAKDNAYYYASTYVGASAHYYVGFNGEIWRSVRDQDIAWSVGGMAYVHPECRNSNSINIELCVRKRSTRTMGATDKDWYFEDATVKSAIELTKYLMQKYNIPASRVIRHYDVNHKVCPNPYVYNNTKHTWNAFKAALTSGSSSTGEVVNGEETWKKTGTGYCTGQDVRVRQVANGPIIGYLGKNETVELDGKISNGWTHVKAACGIGWVSSKYIKKKEDTHKNTTVSTSTLYYVKAGDTLSKIARMYNTTVNALVKNNAIKNPSNISVGQVIKIPSSSSTKVDNSKTELIKQAQVHANNFCGAGLAINGKYDAKMKKAIIKCLQVALNHDYNAGLAVDGVAGNATTAAYKNVVVKKGKKSYTVTFAEIALLAKGYDPTGVECPGNFGNGLYHTIKTFQKDNKLTVCGNIAVRTIKALIS